MVKRCVICSVGTSVLTQNSIDGKFDESRIRMKLKEDAEKASAETNVISKLKLTPGFDEVVLLTADTPESRSAVQLLGQYLDEVAHIKWTPRFVKELDGSETSMIANGLFTFASELCEEIAKRKREGFEVLLNMNGGYKSQCGIFMTVGMLESVPVYYTHTSFSGLVKLPPLPIQWDRGFFCDHEAILEKLAHGVSKSDFENYCREYAPEVGKQLADLTFDLGSEQLGLSPLVEFSFHKFVFESKINPVHCFVSNTFREELLKLEKPDQGMAKNVKSKMKRILRSVDQDGLAKVNSDLLFKGEHRDPIRMAFYRNEDNSAVIFCYLCTHNHEAYERALKEGQMYKVNYPIEACTEFEL